MKLLRVSLVLILTLILFAVPVFAADDDVFADVSESHWAYRYITRLAEDGVVSGYDDGTFKPGNNVSYNEFAAMAVRACRGFNEAKAAEKYNADTVKNYNWATVYHRYAFDNNFYAWEYATGVYSIDFEDTDLSRMINGSLPCTREAAAAIISDILVENRGLDIGVAWLPNLEKKYAIFSEWDGSAGGRYNNDRTARIKYAVSNAIAHGIISGYDDGTFKGGKNITRAEAATMIYRLLHSELTPSDSVVSYDVFLNNFNAKRTAAVNASKVDLSKYNVKTKDGRLAASKAKVKEVIADLSTSPATVLWEESDSYKLAYICQWLNNNAVTQDDQSTEAYKTNFGNEAYSAFYMGASACSGFCKALRLFCDELGYECVIVNEGEWNHQWCKVYVGNHWEIADVQAGIYCMGEHHPYEALFMD